MAVLWIEGFEGFGTTVDAAPSPANVYGRKYTVASEVGGFRVVSGRYPGGYGLKFILDTSYLQAPPLTTNSTLIVGFAFKILNGLNCEFLTFYDEATRGMNLRWVSGGNLAVYRADTQLGITAGLGLQVGVWYYIEFRVYCYGGAAGSYDVHVDGVSVLANPSCNTKAGAHNYHTTFRVQNVWGENPTFDDLYCLDGSGSAPGNTFLGVKCVATIFPNEVGSETQWTPSAGDNYTCVDDVVMDDDGTYVQTAGAGNFDLYGYEDLTEDEIEEGIVGIQINTDVRRTQTATYDLYQPSQLSGTRSDGAASSVTSDTFITKTRVMEKDPSNVAWTLANLASTQFGVLLG